MKTSELKQLIREEIKALLKEATSTTDAKTIKANLQSKKDGVYILKGGLDKNQRWSKETLAKGEPVYYTTDVNDPELNNPYYRENRMLKVEIGGGEWDVSSY
jgi:hypothetical protein